MADPASQSSRGSGGHCPIVLAACGENEVSDRFVLRGSVARNTTCHTYTQVAAWNLENGRSRCSWRVEKNRVGERMRR